MPGWRDLIVCDGVTEPCTFVHIIELIVVLVHDLVLLSTLFVVGAFCVAGFKLLTSGGNENAMKESKAIFLKVVKGYLWILAAWLVVYTITSVLLKDGYSLLGAPIANP